jgi:glycosyltransferase involved in cell wall biosynthesis
LTRRLFQAMAGARYGGAETFFVRLAGALQRAGESQRVLIRRDPVRAQRLRDAGVTVAELAFGGALDLPSRFAFRREIAHWRPDIVLSWMNRATRLCPRGDFVHVGRLGGYYDLKYYRRCDHLIANTRAILDYAVAAGWPRDKIDYLPNFVPDLRITAASPRDTARNGRPRALAVGRLHVTKGFDWLLKALAETRCVELWIAGDGPRRRQLERLATDLGVAPRVAFLGWRDDVPALMAHADLLVCPSLHEPLGNVVIEAWSASLPVVATASDGPVALIKDGETGILVPLPREGGSGASVLAGAIEHLCRDAALRTRLGQAGRHAYEAEFTEASVVTQYRRFFERITA